MVWFIEIVKIEFVGDMECERMVDREMRWVDMKKEKSEWKNERHIK